GRAVRDRRARAFAVLGCCRGGYASRAGPASPVQGRDKSCALSLTRRIGLLWGRASLRAPLIHGFLAPPWQQTRAQTWSSEAPSAGAATCSVDERRYIWLNSMLQAVDAPAEPLLSFALLP